MILPDFSFNNWPVLWCVITGGEPGCSLSAYAWISSCGWDSQDLLDWTTPASLGNMLCFGNRVNLLFLEWWTHGWSCGRLLSCQSAKTLWFQGCWAVMTSELCNAGFQRHSPTPPSNLTLPVTTGELHGPSMTNQSLPLLLLLRPLHNTCLLVPEAVSLLF